MCGGHHVAAGGGKLHEHGARILELEAENVRGDVVNLLVHEQWQSTSVNTRSEPLWLGDGLPCRQWRGILHQESVGHSHHAREETLCLVPESHSELPHNEGESSWR